MSNQYATSTDFLGAKLGVQTKELPENELDLYIQMASAWVEEYLGYAAAQRASVLESLYTDDVSRAMILPSGHVALYPVQAYPIASVSLVQWRARGLPMASMAGSSGIASSTSALVTIDPSNYQVEQDRYGDGYRVRIWLDYGSWRDPDVALEFQCTYAGGYTPDGNGNYPMWLRSATIQYTAHLLKSRGAQAVIMSGEGVVSDQPWTGGHMGKAKDFLNPHRRLF